LGAGRVRADAYALANGYGNSHSYTVAFVNAYQHCDSHAIA
jgi:hypothetical protein